MDYSLGGHAHKESIFLSHIFSIKSIGDWIMNYFKFLEDINESLAISLTPGYT